MSDYPIGATWIGKEISPHSHELPHEGAKREAKIWLGERRGTFEIWYFEWNYPDGSRPVGARDWGISYQNVRNMIPFKCKMKRVK